MPLNNIEKVRLSSLVMDEQIANKVESRDRIFPKHLERCLMDMGTFPLDDSRIDSIMSLDSSLYDPISVEKQGERYIVYNGRHRIAATILNGLDTINVKY